MPAVSFVPFAWYHIKAMDLRADERQHFLDVPDWRERAKAYAKLGPAVTAIVEGEGVACSWGYIPHWRGVFECWLVAGSLVERYPISLIRGAQREINRSAIDLQAHRLQMTVKASAKRALRFAEALRFAPEGVLNSYGPDGSDYVMLARIP